MLQAEKAQKEDRILLAMQVIQNNQNLPVYKAAKLYNASHSTFKDHLAGAQSQAISNTQK
jgi:hypothetical protein